MEKSLTQRQLDALNGSIKKWQDIVDLTGEDEGPENCPCCQEFYRPLSNTGDDCANCPIRDFAKALYCRDTPYEQWLDYYVNEPEEDWAVYDDRSAELAKAEVSFLIEVRDDFIKRHPELSLPEEVTAKWDKIVSETIGD